MTQIISARAVLLDMDGTLVDSTAAVERIWLAWAAAHDLDPAHVLSVIHGRQGHQSMAILLPERDHAINLSENQAMLANESNDVDGVVAIAGAEELLAALGPLPHAIVTSADITLMNARMNEARLAVPALTVTAEKVTASKPHPEGFLLGASLLGMDPADCIVFEDSGAGIQAGKAAGMRVIGVGPHAAAHDPDYVVADLTGVEVTANEEGFTLTLQ